MTREPLHEAANLSIELWQRRQELAREYGPDLTTWPKDLQLLARIRDVHDRLRHQIHVHHIKWQRETRRMRSEIDQTTSFLLNYGGGPARSIQAGEGMLSAVLDLIHERRSRDRKRDRSLRWAGGVVGFFIGGVIWVAFGLWGPR